MASSGGAILQDSGQARSPRIVISYRRGDTNADAGRLFDYLVPVFGKERVFMDIDTIQPGDDFVEAIERAVDASDAIVAVIGPRWVEGLDEPRDFVRFEIATAMKLHKRVIPVLVADAEMPSSDTLPTEISSLSRLQAINVSHLHFRSDAERLVETLRRLRPSIPHQLDRIVARASAADARPEKARRLRSGRLLAGAGILIAIGVVGVFGYRLSRGDLSGDRDEPGRRVALTLGPNTDLNDAKLQGYNMINSDLRGAHLQRADLTGAFLDGAQLGDSDMREARLVNTSLTWADLARAHLSGADLQDADLADANLEGADLRSVRHVSCDQLRRAKGWTSALRDPAMQCGDSVGLAPKPPVTSP